MILRKCDMQTFSEYCRNKKIVCYGIGGEFERIIKNYDTYAWEDRICWLVDSNPKRVGQAVRIKGKSITISSLEQFLDQDLTDVVLFITCLAYAEVVEQLNQIPLLDQMECFLFHFMFALSEGEPIQIRHTDDMLIPPVIHYCWFGGKEMPDLYKQCIESWHRHCPDYEIKEWNETNCDIAETNFTKQAYEVGKYGFVPDYFRLKIIYENGGIYLDTDVEMLKNLDDLRYNHAFCGLEFPGEAAFGLGFGAEKGYEVIHFLMQRYKSMNFVKRDETFDETISPVYQTEDLFRLGMKYGNCLQLVEGLTIYPIEVLSPQNINTGERCITEYSYTLHHYDGSWVGGEHLKRKRIREENVKKLQYLIDKEYPSWSRNL